MFAQYKAKCATPSPKANVSVSKGGEKTVENIPTVANIPTVESSVDPAAPLTKTKHIELKNVGDASKIFADTWHTQTTQRVLCTSHRCLGSVRNLPSPSTRSKEEVIDHATEFINKFYSSIKRSDTPAHQKRLEAVLECIERDGIYDLTANELTFGAKEAWRNAPRCPGRIQWSKLQLFDARHITTAIGMFEALCSHIRYATNNGYLRSAVTVFPMKTSNTTTYRIWNAQLIRYAGYRTEDGKIIGDPASVDFTRECINMGWSPGGGMFDVLPLVVSFNGRDPEIFEIPDDIVLQVNITHPTLESISTLELKWYALPAVSSMMLDCGGLHFTATAFSGWYMSTEIASRDLLDTFRYNLLQPIAEAMGLNRSSNTTLWKDTVHLELNLAVLHSYNKAGVTITDHHSTSDSFIKHMGNEYVQRGGCPADWGWIVPPMSGSATKVFHQEMALYVVKPSYEYQMDAWKTHVWQSSEDLKKRANKFKFRPAISTVLFPRTPMSKALASKRKCLILYATESGKSEAYAHSVYEIFRHAFDPKVLCMEDYDPAHLEHESLVLVVTSTFGNGDPPLNGQEFARGLFELNRIRNDEKAHKPLSQHKKMDFPMLYVRQSCQVLPAGCNPTRTESNDKLPEDLMDIETELLANVRYAVFALGTKIYPHYCAFGHYVDKMLYEMGGDRLIKISEGDGLSNEGETFRVWLKNVFTAACETFSVADASSLADPSTSPLTPLFETPDVSWVPQKYHLVPIDNATEPDLCGGLSILHRRKVYEMQLTEKTNLQASHSSRQTLLMKFNLLNQSELMYKPGDHVGIYPTNDKAQVDYVLLRLADAPPMKQLMRLEILTEYDTNTGTKSTWMPSTQFPLFTVRRMLTNYLDIMTPPSAVLIQLLATQASDGSEWEKMLKLGQTPDLYRKWKNKRAPGLADFLKMFPSVQVPTALLITHLPILQQRYYSISSSIEFCPSQIHTTVSPIQYTLPDYPKIIHYGVASSFFQRLNYGEFVQGFVRSETTFRLPSDVTLPIILVGHGCGVAPLRSFWQQRQAEMQKIAVPTNASGKQGWGDIFLYFGCRRDNTDNLYKKEASDLRRSGTFTENNLALSRDQSMPKTYVQHLMKKNGEQVYDALFKRGGHLYVCGDICMAVGVANSLERIVAEFGTVPLDEAKDKVTTLRYRICLHLAWIQLRIRQRIDHTRVCRIPKSMAFHSSVDLQSPSVAVKRSDDRVRALLELLNPPTSDTEKNLTSVLKYGGTILS